ncbi:hypothetical protein [Rhodovulum adriaticum]|uniref:Uncharacterized protein n=1 Tax=Rhodovulum adriaticum TaxID=35804 RepID=A0A4R2NG07_RHOAD|nr:hypothetical protein [Rhodovulum adriaticum]MBK1636873.1 hypothetical protein [Rhodovulum adriaticum]TCP20283.1 hypothetical protein EV656_12117 [Rhodovulum adriaticum]
MVDENKGGRKRSYSTEQVETAVEIAEALREAVTAQSITRILKSELGVKATPRKETLESEIQTVLDRRERQRNAQMIAELPEVLRGTVAEFASDEEERFLLAAATAYRTLTDESRKPIESAHRYIALL